LAPAPKRSAGLKAEELVETFLFFDGRLAAAAAKEGLRIVK